ncbi:Glucan-binding domain-containing protein (YG repeat) [Ruminococcaceae bacterium YRB3002]|nr:Glucan-binding domain-containing protein (YG repeat) [Ruminococcaceae bacterium YRB3002]
MFMLRKRFEAALSMILAVSMIAGNVVFADTPDNGDDDVVEVSVDVSDYVIQAGGTPGSDDLDDIDDIPEEYVSGDYDIYEETLEDREGGKNSLRPDGEPEDVQDEDIAKEDPADAAEEQTVVTSEEEPVDITEPQETEETAEQETEQDTEQEPQETEDLSEEPVGDDEEVTEEAEAPVYTAYNETSVMNALAEACRNWDGSSQFVVDVSSCGLVREDTKEVYVKFMNTHGEFFFLSPQYKYSYKTSGAVTKYTLNVLPGFTKSDVNKFNTKVNEIVGNINSSWSAVEKALYIHDYIVTHCSYDEDPDNYHYNAYDCLINGSAVCQGYSMAFDHIASKVGLDSWLISSKDLDHAWNMVKAGSNYYFIDSTWDDPMYNYKPLYPGFCKHEYFLLSNAKMHKNKHNVDDWIIDGSEACGSKGTDTTYDSYFWSESVARVVPVGSRNWCYITKDSKTVSVYDFTSNSSSTYATLPESFYNASMTGNGTLVFVSTAKKVYRLPGKGQTPELAFTYTGTAGKIFGIDLEGNTLRYYIYKDNQITFVTSGVFEINSGWVKMEGAWYYCIDGEPVKGLKEIGGDTYYLDETTGAMFTGWKIIDGKQYFFKGNGVMAKGWASIENEWYYFAADGVQVKNEFVKSGSKTYYIGSNGKMVTGWNTINGLKYFFNSDGEMEKSCWKKVGTKWYYLNSYGSAVKSNFYKVGSDTYYFDKDSVMVTGWQQIGGVWYYFASSGAMKTGWQKISKVWYYLGTDGKMATGLTKIGKNTCFFKSSGAMATGWQQIDGNWYYFNSSGYMQTGWTKVSGKWYYMNSSGVMLKNTTVDGYKLGPDGAWKK